MTKPDGGPAFPAATDNRSGMSLRDWFAGQALAGLAAVFADYDYVKTAAENGMTVPEFTAKRVYEYADAMLAERERKEEK